MEATNARGLLLFVTFVDLVGFGILLPILPFAALEVSATPIQIGILASAFSLFQILAMPAWGYAADRWGSKPVLAISLLGNAISYVIFASSFTFVGLLASRVLAGVTSATLGVARGSLTHPENAELTQKNMRLFGAAQGLGFLVGPLLGVLAHQVSPKSPVWLACFIASVAIPFVILKKNLGRPHAQERTGLMQKLNRLKANGRLLRLNWIYGLLSLSFALLFISFPLFLKQAYNFDSHASAIYFSILAVGAVVGQLVVLPLLAKSFRQSRILAVALGLLVVAVQLLGTPLTAVSTGVVLAITSVLLFVVFPIVMAEIGICTSGEDRNLNAGVSESVAGIARLLGTSLSGVVIQFVSVGAVFSLSASTAVLALVMTVLLNKRHQR